MELLAQTSLHCSSWMETSWSSTEIGRVISLRLAVSLNAVLKDSRLHDVWWQADVLVLDETSIQCQLADTMKVKKSELLQVVGKDCHEMSIEASCEQLKLFRHDCKWMWIAEIYMGGHWQKGEGESPSLKDWRSRGSWNHEYYEDQEQ